MLPHARKTVLRNDFQFTHAFRRDTLKIDSGRFSSHYRLHEQFPRLFTATWALVAWIVHRCLFAFQGAQAKGQFADTLRKPNKKALRLVT
jgi:hypothetical protein